MNKLLSCIALALSYSIIEQDCKAQPVFPPATQAEVDAGILRSKFVSPATLNQYSGMTSPTGGVSAGSVTNIVNGLVSVGAKGTNVGVGQSLFLDAAFGNDATAQRTNMARPYLTASNAVYAIVAGDTLVVRGGDYPVHPLADSYDASLLISNKNDIVIRGEPDSIFQLSSLRGDEFGTWGCILKLSRCTNVIIDGMTFRGLRTNGLVEQHYAVMLDRCDNVTFNNVRVINWQNQGVTDLSETTQASNIQFLKCEFSDIGGTNQAALGADGAAISVSANNLVVYNCRFNRNLRDFELCCSGDNRGVVFANNRSVGCYFQSLVLEATNILNVQILNNRVRGYSATLPSGVNEANWMVVRGMSNAVIQGNDVSGMGGVVWVANAGLSLWDVELLDNTFRDIVYGAGIYAIRTVGQNTFNNRMTIKRNKFLNNYQNGIRYGGADGIIEDNRFTDCNGLGDTTGVLCIGSRFASENTNVVNTRIINNQIEATAYFAGTTGIVVYASSSSNSIWGNEISRNYQGAIHDLGVGTLTLPFNLIRGAMVYSDTNYRARPVIIGSGVAFDSSSGTLTGTGSGGGSNYLFDAAVFNAVAAAGNVDVGVKAGAILPGVYADNGILYGGGVLDYGMYYDTGIDTLYFQDARFAPNYTNIFGISNGFANFFVAPVLNDLPAGSLLRTTSAKRVGAVTIGANLTWDGTTLAATGGGGGAFGSDGWVQYANNGTNKAEAAFSYEDGDNILSVTSLLAQSIGMFPGAGSGNMMTSDSVGVGTWRSNITAAGSITASNGFYAAGPGAGYIAFGTNFTMEGAIANGPSVERTPTNANSGINVSLPVAGITNQRVNVALTAGQVVTSDGTNYVASDALNVLQGYATFAQTKVTVLTPTNYIQVPIVGKTWRITGTITNSGAAANMYLAVNGDTNGANYISRWAWHANITTYGTNIPGCFLGTASTVLPASLSANAWTDNRSFWYDSRMTRPIVAATDEREFLASGHSTTTVTSITNLVLYLTGTGMFASNTVVYVIQEGVGL